METEDEKIILKTESYEVGWDVGRPNGTGIGGNARLVLLFRSYLPTFAAS